MRVERVAQEIKREISNILAQELRDPRLGFVTITHVELSADLKNAKAYYSVLGDKKQEESSAVALRKATGFIRKLIGERLNLRFNPEISFKFDKSIAYSVKIEEVLREIKDDK
jgi:ribosome-binding factor A